MRKRAVLLLAALSLALALCACAAEPPRESGSAPTPAASTARPAEPETSAAPEEKQPEQNAPAQEETDVLCMTIGTTAVAADWEDNASVRALRELCRESPLTISMSMYGGFEQVGSIGVSLPRDDTQTTTSAGDIVLYSGSQLVLFYGSNAWAYTRLGHISDRSAEELTTLLGQGDVTVTLSLGAQT